MSTIVRHKRGPRQLGPYRRHELLTGEIRYPENNYSGYGDGRNTYLADFISDEMRRDWAEHRAELIKFWKSGEYTSPEIFPDAKPWLFVCGSPGTLPWACEHLDKGEDDAKRKSRRSQRRMDRAILL
jgi:hypothetical protein